MNLSFQNNPYLHFPDKRSLICGRANDDCTFQKTDSNGCSLTQYMFKFSSKGERNVTLLRDKELGIDG